MSKKRKGGFFSRLIWTIFIVGFFVLGMILFLSTLPSVGVLINYSKTVDLVLTELVISFSLGLKGFGALFGGELDEFAVSGKVTSGDINSEVPDFALPSLGGELAFNYVVLIGIVLVVLGIVLAVLFFRKKQFSLLSALLIVAGAILLCLDSVLFTSINSEALGFLKDVEGLTVIDVPSLLLGILSALSGITVFFHALTIKK